MIEKQLPKWKWQRYGRAGFTMAAILFALWGTLLSILQPPQPAAAATGPRCYVKAGASTPDGDSWATAYATVQDALADANCTEIWVAAGVYYPDEGAGQTNDARTSTFALRSGVALYGGFAGTETALDQRDPAANITVLSGDIDQNDTTDANGVVTNTANINGSNAYHVVTGSGTDSSAVLDGFTITAGQANGSSPDDSGGGMYNSSGSPTLSNVTFSANAANFLGGGMYNNTSNPTLTNVTFSANSALFGGGMNNNPNSSPTLTNITFAGNSASGNGGGMENANNSTPTLTNVTFSGNSATNYGGGMSNWGSSPTLTNVTFSANSANVGGGMYNDSSSPTLTNVIIANSASGGDCVNGSGGSIATGSSNNLIKDTGTNACGLTNGSNGNIIGSAPNLGALTDYGGPGRQVFPLLTGSPAIDTGTNTGCPAADQRGAPRPLGTACDIGAFESAPSTPVTPGSGGGNGPGGVGITDGSSSLELWLKGGAGVTTSGGSVSTWADQSGNSADVTQTTAAAQPTHVTSLASLNNQPAVQFDGSNDYLNIPASVIEGKTAFSFFTAFQWNGGGHWQRLWDFGQNDTINGFITTNQIPRGLPLPSAVASMKSG